MHAPDFSYWRWIELGNPYYEPTDPTSVDDPIVLEDYNSIGRGFNLHKPYPNPFNNEAKIIFNIFHPENVIIDIYNSLGQFIINIFDKRIENIGIQEVNWKPGNIPSRIYYIVMKYGNDNQIRKISYIK